MAVAFGAAKRQLPLAPFPRTEHPAEALRATTQFATKLKKADVDTLSNIHASTDGDAAIQGIGKPSRPMKEDPKPSMPPPGKVKELDDALVCSWWNGPIACQHATLDERVVLNTRPFWKLRRAHLLQGPDTVRCRDPLHPAPRSLSHTVSSGSRKSDATFARRTVELWMSLCRRRRDTPRKSRPSKAALRKGVLGSRVPRYPVDHFKDCFAFEPCLGDATGPPDNPPAFLASQMDEKVTMGSSTDSFRRAVEKRDSRQQHRRCGMLKQLRTTPRAPLKWPAVVRRVFFQLRHGRRPSCPYRGCTGKHAKMQCAIGYRSTRSKKRQSWPLSW